MNAPASPRRQTAIVTGAAGGIGLAVCRLLAQQGFGLFMVDLNADAVTAAAKALAAAGATAHAYAADATRSDQVSAAVAGAAQRFGTIDALVNVAGGSGPKGIRDIELIDDATWDFVVDLNLKSAFLFARAVVPLMRAQKYGRIVSTSSSFAWGRKGPVTTQGARLAYAAANAGIHGLTAQLAKDVAEHGITVNVVVPGLTLGEPGSRIRTKFENLDAAGLDVALRELPMKRPAEAHEVAAAVGFLVSEGASYVSGIALPVVGAL